MSERDRADACPGVLAPHEAVDGPLVRVRVPGGLLGAGALRGLAAAAALGDGSVELTSRGNVQVRAVHDPVAFEATARQAGLLPSATHERVRNILGSPFGGRVDGQAATTEVVTALDRRLCHRSELAALPGRFLFAVDDGSGDVAHSGADVALLAEACEAEACEGGACARWRLLLAGVPTELVTTDPVGTALDAAAAFLAIRGSAWRLGEVADGAVRVAATLGTRTVQGTDPRPHRTAPPVGVFDQADGRHALGVLAPLGRLTAAQVTALASFATVGLTPWRGAVLLDLDDPDAALAAAEAAGLITDTGSPLAGVTACAGKPNCAKALRDVRGDAAATHQRADPGSSDRSPVHWVGCSRRCGTPRGAVLVEADERGYLVDGQHTADLAAAIGTARRDRHDTIGTARSADEDHDPERRR